MTFVDEASHSKPPYLKLNLKLKLPLEVHTCIINNTYYTVLAIIIAKEKLRGKYFTIHLLTLNYKPISKL